MMTNFRIYLVLSFITVFLSSCGMSPYASWQKKKQLIKEEYTRVQDSIYISDVILCNLYGKGLWGEPQSLHVNQDSVLNIFLSSLSKLPLPVTTEGKITFHCDSVFSQSNKNYYMLTIEDEDIKKLAAENKNRYKMIHFIRITTNDILFTSLTASSFSPAGGYRRHLKLGIVVYLFDKDELIYSRMFNYSAKTLKIYMEEDGRIMDDDTEEPVVSTIEQKHWDELVLKVMNDYIKKLK